MAVFDGTNESESDDDLNKQMEAFIEELQNEDQVINEHNSIED